MSSLSFLPTQDVPKEGINFLVMHLNAHSDFIALTSNPEA